MFSKTKAFIPRGHTPQCNETRTLSDTDTDICLGPNISNVRAQCFCLHQFFDHPHPHHNHHYLYDSFVDVEQRERREELNDNLPSPDRPRIPPPSIIRLK